VEIDPDACATFAMSHPEAQITDADISTVNFRGYRGQIAVVAAGVPCQPFSSGGKRLASDDPRDGFPQFIRAIREIQPDAVVVENVAGLVRGSRAPYFESIVHAFRDSGYTVAWKLLNAADYGVPQKRIRLILVALRGQAFEFEFPKPTHGVSAARPWVPSGFVLSQDSIVGEANPSIVTYARRPDPRPSPHDGHLFNGGGRPIDLCAPSHTILASAGGNKTHWIDTLGVVPAYHDRIVKGGRPRRGSVPGARRITVEESALLQSFPPGLKLVGARSSQYTQIGNAVPPLVAAAVGRALVAHLARSAR
jgi:DNA (cytosine-5)-methyltransferase 1